MKSPLRTDLKVVRFLKLRVMNAPLLLGIIISLTACTQQLRPPILCTTSTMEFVDTYYDLDLNLNIAFDDFGALNQCAKTLQKPILTIYGCWGCVGHYRAIWEPLTQEDVRLILQEDFLIRYYHVDDRTALPDSIAQRSSAKNIGQYFLEKQQTKYQVAHQPFYTITNWKEEDLTPPINHVPRTQLKRFKSFLIKGRSSYIHE